MSEFSNITECKSDNIGQQKEHFYQLIQDAVKMHTQEKITATQRGESMVLSRKESPNSQCFILPSLKKGYVKIGGLHGEFKLDDAVKVADSLLLAKSLGNIEFKNGAFQKTGTAIDNEIAKLNKTIPYLASLGIHGNLIKDYFLQLENFQNIENKSFEGLSAISKEILTHQVEKIEVRNEYYVKLKFKKSNISLNPLTHLKNAATASKEDIRVSREDYEKYQKSIGSELSSHFDGIKFMTHQEFASYKVIVAGVEKKSEAIVFDKKGKSYQISDVDGMITKLQQHGGTVYKEQNGDNETYTFSCHETTEKERKKYVLTLEIKNSNFSLNIFKHARNTLNKHQIEVEVPKEVYESVETGKIYDETGINMNSFMIKNRISNIKMKVINKEIKS